jgi:hypothetical protein
MLKNGWFVGGMVSIAGYGEDSNHPAHDGHPLNDVARKVNKNK